MITHATVRAAPNADLFEDMVLLCGKVAVDADSVGVLVSDLLQIRDAISEIRRRVASGDGYKSFPDLRKEDR